MNPGPRHISTNCNMHASEQRTSGCWKSRYISDREHATVLTKKLLALGRRWYTMKPMGRTQSNTTQVTAMAPRPMSINLFFDQTAYVRMVNTAGNNDYVNRVVSWNGMIGYSLRTAARPRTLIAPTNLYQVLQLCR